MREISKILENKGTNVLCIDPSESVIDAVCKMSGAGIGALVVTEGGDGEVPGKVIGIISERDIVSGIANHGKGALNKLVVELTTSDVVSCRRDDKIFKAMEKMVEGKFRHLPVIEDDELKGIVSINDVVQFRIKDLINIIKA